MKSHSTPWASWFGSLKVGAPRRVGALDVVPLVRSGDGEAPFLPSHQAIAAGLLEVLEKDGGVVQELLARSRADRPVVIIEGETLIGAKQNRMVAHTVVVAPGATVVVPVGCMERGRWRHETASFRSGRGMSDYRMRAAAKFAARTSREHGYGVRLDQSRLWDQVDHELARENVASPTADYDEVMERRDDAAAALRDVAPAAGQVGVLVMHEGRLVGLEVVGHPDAWRGVSERVLWSYLPALSDPDLVRHARSRQARPDPDAWLRELSSATVRPQPAVGMGEDLDIRADGLMGSGVWLGAAPAHVSVFAEA